MEARFRCYVPQNELLRKYISYFYTDYCENENYTGKYSFYPHIFTTLSFYKQSSMSLTDDQPIYHDPHQPLLKLLTHQHSIQTVSQRGKIDKIGIVFYPLGLNHFVTDPYCKIAPDEKQIFNPENTRLWDEKLIQIFCENEVEVRMKQLEGFLVNIYRPRNYDTMYSVLKTLNDVGNLKSIPEIAKDHHMSHRSLNRLFQREMGISPEKYRMIARFRFAVNERILSNRDSMLTEIAYDSGYLDQPYMIKCFRKLTGLSPRAFFEGGTHIGLKDTFWHIKEK